MRVQTVGGELVEAMYVRHLRTLTQGSGCDGRSNVDVDLVRLAGGRLVVCTSPANDSRATPLVDPDSTPEDYGYHSHGYHSHEATK